MNPIDFDRPAFLFLLLALPLLLVGARRSLAGFGRTRLALATACRGLIWVLVVGALASPAYLKSVRKLWVVFLLDRSDSMSPQQRRAAEATVREASAKAKAAGVGVGVVEFARKARQAREPDESRQASPLDGGETNIASAIHLARAMFPPGVSKRIVLLSDGNETEQSAVHAAHEAQREGVSIWPMSPPKAAAPELLVEELAAPAQIDPGTPVRLRARVRTRTGAAVKCQLYRDGFLVAERNERAAAGANSYEFQDTPKDEGTFTYRLVCTAAADSESRNNEGTAIVMSGRRPTVLYLEGDEPAGRYLARALEAEKVRVDLRGSYGFPTSLQGLMRYGLVILSDVPAAHMSDAQMELLKVYVHDLGGGFVMTGGEQSFGLGGYFRTTVEDMLPVSCRPEKRKEHPSIALMLLIDKSGSMSGAKIELAKEAARATVDLLGPDDEVGTVVFDAEAYWVAELQSARNKSAIEGRISAVKSGGGTNMYPALHMAHRALLNTRASIRHAIALTDGQTQPADFYELVSQMAADRITVSTVGVGEGADVALLRQIAEWGGGRYYFTDDAYNIPRIFTRETMLASKSSIVEQPFVPQVAQPGEMLRGIDFDRAPFLLGYCLTVPMPTARIHLVSDRADVVLASWRYGLGQTLAFTSDVKNRWASDWLTWPGYRKFWAQLVRTAMRTTKQGQLHCTTTVAGTTAAVSVDALDEIGRFRNGLDTKLRVIGPDLAANEVVAPQTAPGRYECRFPVREPGTYLVKVIQSEGGKVVGEAMRGVAVSYSPEYRSLGPDEELLRALAATTGGRLSAGLDEVLAPPAASNRVRIPMWPWLLLAATVLLVVDVAIRRVEVGGRET